MKRISVWDGERGKKFRQNFFQSFQSVSSRAIDFDDRSSQSDDEVSVSENCVEKLQSFNESHLTESPGLGDESIYSLLGGEGL